MGMSEADTRAKLIDPAIQARGWSEDFIRREESAGTIEIAGGKARQRARGRVDYTLRVRVTVGRGMTLARVSLTFDLRHLPAPAAEAAFSWPLPEREEIEPLVAAMGMGAEMVIDLRDVPSVGILTAQDELPERAIGKRLEN